MASHYLIGVLLVAWFHLAVTGQARPSDPQPVKTYNVSFDDDPSVRWNQVLDDHRVYLPDIFQFISEYVPSEYIPILRQIALDIETLLPDTYAKEIIGVAQYWGMNTADVIMLNIVYDFTAYCTSIVAQDTNGTIWHARNLDYDDPDLLRNLTVSVNFQRGGQTLYTATTYAGYVGVLTGQKPNAFTITIDQRGVPRMHQGYWWENILVAILDKSASFVSFLVRQTLEESPDFNSAVDHLSTTVIHAPAYIIVGGTQKGEGVIITRDRLAAVDRYYLNLLEGRWYVLETNYDHWTTPPPDDDRRTAGEGAMNKLGQAGINVVSLFNVLSTPLVLNSNTTYSIVMSAVNPQVYKAQVRWTPAKWPASGINNFR
ncbi:hypothetical protein C0Q70_07700 [Pomacea canaliculata]|uniref:N-acylethanolamine-hydrolyzing acid amidase n=1 Tax=Pomacea canaliculata TaxID=400727 RepID=A0A2T7PFR8_POMCA|nr:N-acylethanolamine-hydrolyzing acid amidase-like [Pomacea canaliculata]PVD32267.1 hypothetical protein C0Q70_07700 [Pomacea canaliculata]